MDLIYIIKRSPKRKKLSITVERDRTVVVHAPTSSSDETIHQVVESKRQWIYEKLHHLQKYAYLPHPPGKELVNGESALFLGKSYRIEIVKTEQKNIQLENHFLIPEFLISKGKSTLRDWYIEKAKSIILQRVEELSNKLGVEYNSAKISDNQYRWGSCTEKNNLTFNWRLIKAPMFVIDYVIIHELTHLLEPNHTSKFWNIVRAHTPKMDQAKLWLLENGQLLEDSL